MENFNRNLVEQNKLLLNQNKILDQINNLIARQNHIVAQQKSTFTPREIFVSDLNRDEMRSGFLVTSHRKKLWNVQIELINELARICKKHNLKWFACGGTLLGAARHKGFIPWDDDVDIAMFRPDYNKFIKIAAEEIKEPYFLDNWCNYRLEIDEKIEYSSNLQFPLITNEQQRNSYDTGWPFFPAAKIRDSRTTLIETPNRLQVNQGIWIDIFPFDIMPPFKEDKHKADFEAAREFLLATLHPNAIRQALKSKQQFILKEDELRNFIKLPYKQRGTYFDNFAEQIFFRSEKVGDIRKYAMQLGWDYDTKNFDEIIYVPFEKIEIPVPYNYDNVLKSQYGNWHEMKITHVHAKEWSADIPYYEYYKTSVFMKK